MLYTFDLLTCVVGIVKFLQLNCANEAFTCKKLDLPTNKVGSSQKLKQNCHHK